MLLDARLEQMTAMAEEAGRLAQAMRADPARLGTREKGAMDLVTSADHAVEAHLRERIAASDPGASVLGEEHGLEGDGPSIWIVDPIDGTVNFARGMPEWAISIACYDGDRLTHGVIHAPDLGLTGAGRIGHGALLNGREVRLGGAAGLAPIVSLGYSPRIPLDGYLANIRGLLDRGVEHRRHGAATIGLLGVLAGWFDAYYEGQLNVWDAAAGLVLIEAAGGTVRHDGLSGFLTSGSPVLAHNGSCGSLVEGLYPDTAMPG